MSRYPQDAPVSDIQKVIAAITGTETELAVLAESGWWVQGYVQKLTIGDGSPPIFGAEKGEMPEATDENAVKALESLLPTKEGEPRKALPFNGLFLKMLLEFLSTWLKNKIG